MALTEAYSGSASISTTEWSLPSNAAYSSGSPITDDGVYSLYVDLSDMIAGDDLILRVYEKCRSASTQRILHEVTLVGVQSEELIVFPALALMHGWDVTMVAVSGSVTVEWSIRKVA